MEYGAQINFLLSETADHVILRKEKKKKRARTKATREEGTSTRVDQSLFQFDGPSFVQRKKSENDGPINQLVEIRVASTDARGRSLRHDAGCKVD